MSAESVLADLVEVTGSGHAKADGRRLELAAKLIGPGGLAEAGLRDRTACLTLLAGAGTRWVASLAEAAARPEAHFDARRVEMIRSFPPEAPRGLFPVRNFIRGTEPYIPLAAYAVDAFRSLGAQTLVVRGWEEKIASDILDPLAIDRSAVRFVTQEPGPGGKVLGHGDAAFQARGAWLGKRYLMVNFGGDANSPLTAAAGLRAIALLDTAGVDCGLLLPVARIPGSAYPIVLDDRGFPVSFGHDKLTSAEARAFAPGTAVSPYANVGIRIYRTDLLEKAMSAVRGRYWDPAEGYSIPGNDPAGHEFALDNVDAMLAASGLARILPLAEPDELTPAKKFGEVANFEEAAARVRAEWDAFLKF